MSIKTGTVLRVLLVLLALGNGFFLFVPTAQAQTTSPANVNVPAEAELIRDGLQQAMREYRLGNYDTAYKLARGAYLDHFENIEIPLRVMNADLTADMEFRFAALRGAMEARQPIDLVEKDARSVRDGVDEVEAMFSGPGLVAPLFAFGTSFSIIFREGLEASLVVAAVLAYLESSNNRRLKKPVLWGVAAAIGFSALSWVLVNTIIQLAPVGREVIEAAVSLFAVVMLFWVSFWLIRKMDNKRWMEFIKARAWSAMASGSTLALAMLGFTAVYREGLETALFYQVLATTGVGVELYVVGGFVLGIAALAVAMTAMFRAGRKLPVGRFLSIAATIIMILSVAFLGNAVRQLQDIGVLGTTSLIGVVPRLPHLLAELTGIHPTVETIVAQLALAAVYAGGVVIFFLKRSAPRPTAEPRRRPV
ncbi:MAG TPA: FTR1 family protein [Chloroflexia bacterium]|nr:FTR1 family protein [Chloroflexia bacterium]